VYAVRVVIQEGGRDGHDAVVGRAAGEGRFQSDKPRLRVNPMGS